MTDKLTFSQYLTRCAIRKEQYPALRMGQVYFGVLHEINPDLAEKMAGHFDDPFHDDGKIGNFLSHIYVVGDWA